MLLLIQVAFAATYTVPDDGEFADVATYYAVAGDTIVLAPGYTPLDGDYAAYISVDLTITGDASSPAELPMVWVTSATVSFGNVVFAYTGVGSPDAYVALDIYDAEVEVTASTFAGKDDAMAVYGIDSVLRFTDVDVHSYGGDVAVQMGYETIGTYGYSFEGGRFYDNPAGAVSLSSVDGATKSTFSGTEFSNNGSYAGITDVFVDTSELTIDGAYFHETVHDYAYGSVWAYNAYTTISNSTWYNYSLGGGALIQVTPTAISTLTVAGCTFEADSPDYTVASAISAADGDTTITDSTFRGFGLNDDYGEGSAILSNGGLVRIEDCSFEGLQSNFYPAALYRYGSNSSQVKLYGNRFCGNEARTSVVGGVVSIYGSAATLAGNVFDSNGGTDEVLQIEAGNFTIVNNTFVENAGTVISGYPYSTDILNNIFVANDVAISADIADDDSVNSIHYSLYYANDDDGDRYYTSAVRDDPRFVDTYLPGDCDTDPYLAANSPAIDAGLNSRDASDPYDIGAYDGEYRRNAGTHQTEYPGDDPVDTGDTGDTGITIPDADGDGVPEGRDCDDNDAQISPEAWDEPGDGVDADCDGQDATTQISGGCGCSGAPVGLGAGFGALGSLAVFVRRRR